MVGRVMVQVPTILVVLLPHIVSIRYTCDYIAAGDQATIERLLLILVSTL
jgi:hypothetical protein